MALLLFPWERQFWDNSCNLTNTFGLVPLSPISLIICWKFSSEFCSCGYKNLPRSLDFSVLLSSCRYIPLDARRDYCVCKDTAGAILLYPEKQATCPQTSGLFLQLPANRCRLISPNPGHKAHSSNKEYIGSPL